MPPTMRPKAAAWYQCGASPSRAVDIRAANSGVRLLKKAATAGYDGVCGLVISHPKIAEGGVEVVVYGTGFRYADGRGG